MEQFQLLRAYSQFWHKWRSSCNEQDLNRVSKPASKVVSPAEALKKGVQMQPETVLEMPSQAADQQTAKRWNALFSSLAFSEEAAAVVCNEIAINLEKNGLTELAKKYRETLNEELNHFRLLKEVCEPVEVPPPTARDVYAGKFFLTRSNLELMSLVHLVFEPSALAFLGYLKTNAHKILPDNHEWQARVQRNFSEILRDEVSHVHEGRSFVLAALATASDEEKALTKKSMRKHRAFIKAGLASFFRDMEGGAPVFITDMLSRFDFYFHKTMEGIAI
jgi:uncharacterized ferritin-like protein (DUF455 family)